MPFFIQYIIKLSISLGIVYLFYLFVLRRLTFYNWNRWYLLGYTLLSFIIPFINLTPALERNELENTPVIKMIPGFTNNILQIPASGEKTPDKWGLLLWFVLLGALLLLVRFLIQLVAYRKMHSAATLISSEGVNLYQVDKNIIPFSFGNSIYLNRELHSQPELQEIIRHEFVHIKQYHTLDMIWTEILCMVNWYNPVVWLIRKSVRQNLEFIADQQVLEKGIDKKEYQYLLLKVIGNNSFSIASNFNFSSLKKRIAMMNKMRSARLHLIKFLFILPMLAVMLLAFRNKMNNFSPRGKEPGKVVLSGLVVDAVTKQPLDNATLFCKEINEHFSTDQKGYFKAYIPFKNEELKFSFDISKDGYKGFSQHEHWGNFTSSMLYEKYGHTIEFFALSPINSQSDGFSFISGNPADEEGLNYTNVFNSFHKTDWKEMRRLNNITDTIPEKAPPPPPPPAKTPPPPPPPPKKGGVTPEGKELISVSVAPVVVEGKPSGTSVYVSKNEEVVKSNIKEVVVTGYKKTSVDVAPVVVTGYKKASVDVAPVVVTGYKTTSVDVEPVVVTGYSSISRDTVGGNTPMYIVDGKVSSKEELDKLDPAKIESMNVLKGESAIKKYGEKGKDGVIEIQLKSPLSLGDFKGLVLIDGKELPPGKKLEDVIKSADEIKSMNILKGQDATKKYGWIAKDGAIEIYTKKNSN